MSNKILLSSIDLAAERLLPSDWIEQVIEIIDKHGVETQLSGHSDLSREANDEHISLVRVVFGEDCREQLPWLWSLYVDTLPLLIKEQCGRTVYPAIDVRSAVNINCLYKTGSDYEKHVDSNPLTGLLFCCDANVWTGGQLVFEPAGGGQETIDPRLGWFVGFDAREIPHYVSPLRAPFRRTSIPMNYYSSATDQQRPYGLDERLYGDQTS